MEANLILSTRSSIHSEDYKDSRITRFNSPPATANGEERGKVERFRQISSKPVAGSSRINSDGIYPQDCNTNNDYFVDDDTKNEKEIFKKMQEDHPHSITPSYSYEESCKKENDSQTILTTGPTSSYSSSSWSVQTSSPSLAATQRRTTRQKKNPTHFIIPKEIAQELEKWNLNNDTAAGATTSVQERHHHNNATKDARNEDDDDDIIQGIPLDSGIMLFFLNRHHAKSDL